MERRLLGLSILGFVIALSISACGGKGVGSGNDNKPGPAPTSQCTAGQVWVAQYGGCFSTANCPVPPNPANSGWVPQANGGAGQCIVGTPGGITPNPVGSNHLWTGTLVITDNGRYQDLLSDKGICESLYNWYSCSYYDDGAEFGLAVSGNAVPAGGAPATASFYGYEVNFGLNGLLYVADVNTDYQMASQLPHGGTGGFFHLVARPPTTPVPVINIQTVPTMRVELWYRHGGDGDSMFGYVDVFLRY